jgi:(4S)-4-hydroxy-5-phosphonooxypentane-2,3-dione isomerase
MITVHVHVHVHQDRIDDFRVVTLENAQISLQEPGVVRFDVFQHSEELTRFLLVEVYRSSDDPGKHKDTIHYKKWRDAVESMMLEPRFSIRYAQVFPTDKA